MDIAKKKKKKSFKKYGVLTFFILVVIVSGIAMGIFGNVYSVKRETLSVATVISGDFSITVRAPGYLVPGQIQFLTSEIDGFVQKINLKTGMHVKRGDLILELSNPSLLREAEQLKWELEQAKAEFRALDTDGETQLLQMNAKILKTEMELNRSSNRYDTYMELKNRGGVGVPLIEFHDTKLLVKMHRENLTIDNALYEQLELNNQAREQAKQAQVKRLERIYESKQLLVDSLQVRATIDGVVQSLPLKMGQRVSTGTNMVILSRPNDLIAQLQVPEHAVSAVAVEQTVEIITRNSRVRGVVARVEPTVENGTVLVDVIFTGELPSDARADLSIDGEITVASRANTLFVKRPSLARQNAIASVYKLSPEGSTAKRVDVKFGMASSTEVEVLAGLKGNEQIIVSEQNSFQRHDEIRIK